MSMARDLLEQLAEAPVPPVPESFNRALHERINNRLLVGQLVDLGLNGTGYTLEHFARAMAGFFKLTLTGKFEPGAKEGPGTAP
jgi:hypothetical protein